MAAPVDKSLRNKSEAGPSLNPDSSRALSSEQRKMERTELVNHIKKDPLALDLQLCLISSAAKTYRRETTMKPLPKFQNSESQIEASRVFELVDNFPSLTRVMVDPECLSSVQLQFLDWVANLRNQVTTCKLTDVPPSVGISEPLPDFIFKVNYPQEKEVQFSTKLEGKRTFYALHGSRLENFHSISQFGLLGNMSKEGLFGEGVYLSNEQSVSLNHSFSSHGWSRSKIGSSLSCVALCQVIDDPESVKRGSAVAQAVNESVTSSTAAGSTQITNSLGLPESYVLVKNGELIMLRYLLIYRTSRSRLQRRLAAIYDEYYVQILAIMGLLLAIAIYIVFKVFWPDEDETDLHSYLNTEYVHQNIIV